MISYSWKVLELYKNPLGVITRVYWLLTGTDIGTLEDISLQGSFPLDPPTNTTDDFVPFESLSEKIVVEWLNSHREADSKKKIIENAFNYEEPEEQPVGSLPWE